MSQFPTLQQAEQIWQEGLNYRCATTDFQIKNEYIFHTQGVASAAQKIAAKTPYLNPEKAYILGLLHDYGKKYDERSTGVFHGRRGYEELMQMGYPMPAQICLTHTFPNQDFDDDNFKSYPKQDLIWVRQKLSNIIYDDYDRLIQLCDKFFEGLNIVDFETRFTALENRYHLSVATMKILREESYKLKEYFEQKINCDIYQLLNIKTL